MSRVLTQALKERAHAEGFDLVGVAAAARPHSAEILERWLAAGMHADMHYLADTAEARQDPDRVLAGCRSLVVVAMSYHTSLPASSAPREPGRVWVSRYAWGRDYHRVLRKRLLRLGRWLQGEVPGCTWRVCVDTAPVAERSWAAMAGLGWIGKNGMLLSSTFGSELFLGVLLSDVPLLADEPIPPQCGTCTDCLDACPTAALVEPGLVDARRCLSYLTIEHRGAIPEQYEPLIGSLLAGCDRCQEVCPWTRGASADLHPELQPAPGRYCPQLEALEQMQEAEFRAWRAGSPLTRLSYAQLRRNLAILRRNTAAALKRPDTG